MKKLIFNIVCMILIMLYSNVNAQLDPETEPLTIEQRIQSLEQRVGNIEDSLDITHNIVVQLDTNTPKPIDEGIVMSSVNSDVFIFNPAISVNGTWKVYCIKPGGVYLATSTNGANTWTYTLTSAKAGSIILVNGIYYDTYHRWYGGQSFSYYSASQDGITFSDIATGRDPVGEDRNVIWNGTKYMNFGRTRVPPAKRTIMYQESSDFRTWTTPVTILTPDALDGANTDFYHLSVIKTDNGYFGLLNLYYRGNSGQDVEQLPPYAAREHTTEIQLVWSNDGKNWTRLNHRKIFLARGTDIQQMFAWWSIVGNYAYIYTAESKRKHTTWANANDFTGKQYFSKRYKISLANLYLYH